MKSTIVENPFAVIDHRLDRQEQLLAEILNRINATPSPIPTTGKRYRTAKEAADFLGIKLQTLYQNVGKIPHISKHGKLHFIEAELIAYMEGGQTK